jgi:hypothetical protein
MQHWIDQIDNNTNRFLDHFGRLNPEELNWKTNPETWSIAQNLDHLIVINSSYFPALEQMRNGKYKLPMISKFGFLVSFFGKTVLKAVEPERKKKSKTFPIWEPDESTIPGDILDRFSSHQEDLKKEIELSALLIEQGALISSPANRNIVYKLETAFDIIVTHEQRHLEQAKEVLDHLKMIPEY